MYALAFTRTRLEVAALGVECGDIVAADNERSRARPWLHASIRPTSLVQRGLRRRVAERAAASDRRGRESARDAPSRHPGVPQEALQDATRPVLNHHIRVRRRSDRGRPSGAGQVADASAWLGEGLEPIRFDASPEFRERSPDEAEMDWTDDGLVARRDLLEGAAF
jgi:hypothetical protein